MACYRNARHVLRCLCNWSVCVLSCFFVPFGMPRTMNAIIRMPHGKLVISRMEFPNKMSCFISPPNVEKLGGIHTIIESQHKTMTFVLCFQVLIHWPSHRSQFAVTDEIKSPSKSNGWFFVVLNFALMCSLKFVCCCFCLPKSIREKLQTKGLQLTCAEYDEIVKQSVEHIPLYL